MTDRERAIDRFAERLVGFWTTAMLRSQTDPDGLGRYLKHAMKQTEDLAGLFYDHAHPPVPEKPTAGGNGPPAQTVKK